MKMVGHLAVGMTDPIPHRGNLPQKIEESPAVLVILIDWLLAVAPGGYMIKGAWVFDP
jgi:hypothetical protein